jgi:hypothetical protein
MNWIGAVSGAILGSARGGGIVGGLIGSVVGNWVEEKIRERLKKPQSRSSENRESRYSVSEDTSASPYDVLGVSPHATDEEVKRAYRAKVRRLHPDTLQGKDLPEEVIATVNDQMARVNAAWSAIKNERKDLV